MLWKGVDRTSSIRRLIKVTVATEFFLHLIRICIFSFESSACRTPNVHCVHLEN